jgi:hypothetical protein
LGIVALLDEAQRIGILGEVNDEGNFWETRSLEQPTKEIGDQSAMLAGFLGALKDAMDHQPPCGTPRFMAKSSAARSAPVWPPKMIF